MKTSWNISELAKEFDLTTRTIRYYETIGLVAPARKGNTRIYHKRDRVRLRLTIRGKGIGFSLTDIKEILDMYDGTDTNNTRQLERILIVIDQKRAELDKQVRDIRVIRAELDLVEQRCVTSLDNANSRKSVNTTKSNKLNKIVRKGNNK